MVALRDGGELVERLRDESRHHVGARLAHHRLAAKVVELEDEFGVRRGRFLAGHSRSPGLRTRIVASREARDKDPVVLADERRIIGAERLFKGRKRPWRKS